MNLHHIESRPSRENKDCYEFFVACDNVRGGLQDAVDNLKDRTTHLQVLSRNPQEQKDEGTTLCTHTYKYMLCTFVVFLLAFKDKGLNSF